MTQEIERKWVLVRVSPDLPHGISLLQGYIPMPKENVSFRVRRQGAKRVVTFKGPGRLVRYEAEFDLSDHREIFELLIANCEVYVLKTRYAVPDGLGKCYIDCYDGDHLSLRGKYTAEKEFPSEEEARAWILPQWMVECGAREVTDDPRYLNENLAKNGWPEE